MENSKDFSVFAGSSHPELGKGVAAFLGKPLDKITLKTFSSGEKYVALEEEVRGKNVFLIQTCRDQGVNEDYVELFLMADAAKQAYAESVCAVIPYFGYSRQDKIHGKREAISAKVMAKLLVASGVKHVVTFQLHSDQIQGFFDVPVDHLKVHDLFAEHLKKKKVKNWVVVSTDAGGVKNAKELANLLGAEIAVLHKHRPEHNQSEVTHVIGDVKGKTCIIYDDIIDTAGSVCNAQKAILAEGANPQVYLCATHAIFSGPAIERLKKAKFEEVVVTDTLPLGPKKKILKITQQKSVSNLG